MNCQNKETVIDLSVLKADNFTVLIPNMPIELEWNLLSMELPGVAIEPQNLNANTYDKYVQGVDETYDACQITFKVSKNLRNYLYAKKMVRDCTKDVVNSMYIDLIITDTSNRQTGTGFRLIDAIINNVSGLSFSKDNHEDLQATMSFTISRWELLYNGNIIDLDNMF